MTLAAESAGKRQNRTADGRFLPGHRLGGRPRGVDLRALVEERASTDPTIGSTEDLLWAVVVTLARRSALGDVPAARLLLEHLAAPPDAPAPSALEDLAHAEVVRRIAEILRDAKRRASDRRTELDATATRTLSHHSAGSCEQHGSALTTDRDPS